MTPSLFHFSAFPSFFVVLPCFLPPPAFLATTCVQFAHRRDDDDATNCSKIMIETLLISTQLRQYRSMSTDAFKMKRILHRRDTSSYCGYRRLGIALDANRNQLHHALVHSAGIACVDVETGQTISSTAMPGTSGAKDCAFSTPENICCCAEGRSILCFDSRQPSVAMQVHAIQSAVSAISCSNDGRYVAYSSSDSSVGLFSLRMSCVVRPGLFHTSCVNSCYFQDDNSGFWTAVSP
jgi:WD40 repeat protein